MPLINNMMKGDEGLKCTLYPLKLRYTQGIQAER